MIAFNKDLKSKKAFIDREIKQFDENIYDL